MKKERLKKVSFALLLALGVQMVGCFPGVSSRSGSVGSKSGRPIVIFAGAASKPALEKVAQVFEEKMGRKVELNFGGSGTMLSQMVVSKVGDLYMPGSQDFMEKAIKMGVVDKKTIKVVAYLIPAIVVAKGNPQNIESLEDLTRPGLRLAIADPQTVCLGVFAQEIFSRAERVSGRSGLRKEIEKNIVTYAKSCEDLASILMLGQVDAIIGWTVFKSWHPGKMDIVRLRPEQIPKIGYIPIGVTKFAKDVKSAQAFIDFITSSQGGKIFKSYGYEITKIKN